MVDSDTSLVLAQVSICLWTPDVLDGPQRAISVDDADKGVIMDNPWLFDLTYIMGVKISSGEDMRRRTYVAARDLPTYKSSVLYLESHPAFRSTLLAYVGGRHDFPESN